MADKIKNLTIKETDVEIDQENESEELLSDEDEGQLAIDVYQTPDEIIVETPIAGVKPDDLDISITTESITVKGKR